MSSYLKYAVGIIAFKCAKCLAPIYLSDHFVTRSVVHDRNTRKKDSFNILGYKSASGADNALFIYVKLPFGIPYHVQLITVADGLQTFKKKLGLSFSLINIF